MWRKRFQDLARNAGDQIYSLTKEYPNVGLKPPAEKFTLPEWYEQFIDFVGEQLPGPDILSQQAVDRWYSHENDLRTALAKLLMSSV